jgi:RimJ/RimL family protein N-acetyltransferase
MDITNLVEQVTKLTITSERLIISKVSEVDFDVMVAHEQNPNIMHYIRPVEGLSATQSKVKKAIAPWQGEEKEWCMLVVKLKNTNKVIGMVCFNIESVEAQRVEIGYRFDEPYHGYGYGFEAAKALFDYLLNKVKPHKITAYCFAENSASVKILTKLGMQQEGLLRQHSKIATTWHDELIFGILCNGI